MSQGLRGTKRRIQSISSTKKITKAMELVATVKLKKWKDSMDNILNYLDSMNEIIYSCASDTDTSDVLELKKFKNTNATLYVVVTSSLGLCGGYNYNVYKFLNSKLKKDDKIMVLGTKGLAKMNADEKEAIDDYVDFLDKFDYAKVTELSRIIINEYAKGIYQNIELISTKYVNSITFTPDEYHLLPFENLSENTKEINSQVLFEPNKEEVLKLIVPKYLNTLLYAKLVESIVCEQACRRNAMDNANDNAEELLGKLQIEFNKARQAAITQEITEVVGGANNV